jgi:hypothetical protein
VCFSSASAAKISRVWRHSPEGRAHKRERVQAYNTKYQRARRAKGGV